MGEPMRDGQVEMQTTFLLYGATGYTGELIARAALLRGLRPILAGRNATALQKLAEELGLTYRAFDLEKPATIDEGLAGVSVVLNCAGPFSFTARKLAEACLRVGAHYLDIAGEVPEFQLLHTYDSAAQAANVMLLPGVGFGIVPTDALALHLKTRLPTATQLSLAFHALGGVSRGTLLSTLKDLPNAGVVRQDGKLVPRHAGAERRRIDFGQGPLLTVTNPWRGDIFTAYYSTGIPGIKTYTVYPIALRIMMALSTPLKGVFRSAALQNFLKRQAQRQPPGPSAQERSQGKTVVWGEATDASGQRVVSHLVGPEAYDFTVLTALTIVERVLAGEVQPGFHTPSQVFGADLVLSIPGVKRTDQA
ncbi:saccharopine dehydrogenase [Dictyobacter vulcani]|uniref:Saccharopine dehydrogenase n=1 Tax=Dictyobacter vulcani TaxID=2607529 RepID=A0A5J4KRU8_9CHLR|nr:saccharopine dehydrogenase NADP-binding domain-containing protein [Dictyobacter vulcani]GER90625.1 saccharopine dehydrogenase [Dictyobacter vulcani]